MTIDLLTAFIIAAVTALVVVLVMRSIAARQVAETRAASIAELAATKQDLKWVREDAERKAQALDSAQTLLDNAEKRLRDTFQALAAEALKDNRASFLDLAKTSFESYQQPIAETLKRWTSGSARPSASESRRTRVCPNRSSRSDRPPTHCLAHFARRRCAGAGARCSFGASSRSPACCSAATSTSSPAVARTTAGCVPT